MSDEYFQAIKSGKIDLVRSMIMKDPSLVNAKNQKEGLSAVVTAKYYNEPQITELLVQNGADLNLFEASMVGKKEHLTKILEERPSALNEFSQDGFTALHLAAFFGNIEIVKVLLARGSSVNAVAKNRSSVMPLHSAVAHNQLEISRLLLAEGALVDARQEGGFTPLHEAAQNGNLEMAKLLVESGADLDSKLDDGKTPLDLTKIGGKEAGKEEDRERVRAYLLGLSA